MELSATNLKNGLWDTFNKLKGGATDVKIAQATCAVSREIIRTISTQLRISTLSERDVPADVIKFNEK